MLSPLPARAYSTNISFLPISFTWALHRLREVGLPGTVIIPLYRWKTKTREIYLDFLKAIELWSSRGRIWIQAFCPHVVSSHLLPLAPFRSCCMDDVPQWKRGLLCGLCCRPGGCCPLCFCYKRLLKTYRSRILKAEQWTYMLSTVFWSNYIICNYISPFRHNLCCSISSTSIVFNFTFPSRLNADLAGWRVLGGQSKLMVYLCLHCPKFMRLFTFSLVSTLSPSLSWLFKKKKFGKFNIMLRASPRRTRLYWQGWWSCWLEVLSGGRVILPWLNGVC